jgi:hypothetical protein
LRLERAARAGGSVLLQFLSPFAPSPLGHFTAAFGNNISTTKALSILRNVFLGFFYQISLRPWRLRGSVFLQFVALFAPLRFNRFTGACGKNG